jgi:hypothetical protein
MGAFDVPLEWTGQLRPVRDVAVPVLFAANRGERAPGAYHKDVTVQADQFAEPNARIGQNPHQ